MRALNPTTVITAAALLAGIMFQIDWLFFLSLALTAVIILTSAKTTNSHAHKHEEKHEDETEEDEEAEDEEELKEEKEQLIIVKQPVHPHPSEILQHKIDEEIIDRAITLPWEHIEGNWWKGDSESYGHKPHKKGHGKGHH